MRSTLLPFRLLAVCLPLLSTACGHPSTPSSIARTERPTLPKLDPRLTRVERLKPLEAKPTGELVTIDKGILAEVLERLAEAIAAVARGNNRVGGVIAERACVAEIFATGVAPAACAAEHP